MTAPPTNQQQFDQQTGLSFCHLRSSESSESSESYTILVIHGLGCTKRWFSLRTELGVDVSSLPESRELGQNVSWLVPDLIGFGESRRATDVAELDMNAQGERVFQLAVSRLSPSDRVLVVAHSMGGPVGIAFAEHWARAAAPKPFALVAVAIAEGNVDENDCFGSGKIAATPFAEFEAAFNAKLAHDKALVDARPLAEQLWLARGEPALDPVQVASNGAFTMHGSATALVAASKRAVVVPRLVALRDADVPLVFVIGEKNRGKFTSEQALRDAGLAQHEIGAESSAAASGDIAFVPQCGHGMHYDNPEQFWRVIAKIGQLFNLRLASRP